MSAYISLAVCVRKPVRTLSVHENNLRIYVVSSRNTVARRRHVNLRDFSDGQVHHYYSDVEFQCVYTKKKVGHNFDRGVNTVVVNEQFCTYNVYSHKLLQTKKDSESCFPPFRPYGKENNKNKSYLGSELLNVSINVLNKVTPAKKNSHFFTVWREQI